MKYALFLLDKAAEKAGSYYRVAKLTGLSETTITSIRKGRRSVPLDVVPLLADLAGHDPKEALSICLVEQEKDPARGERLRAILGKPLAIGAAVMLLFFVSSSETYSIAMQTIQPETTAQLDMLYIVSITLGALITVFLMTQWGFRAGPARRASLLRRSGPSLQCQAV